MENIEYSLDSFGRVRKTIIPILNYTESQVSNLNERESHYINLYKNDPLNLNIMIPKDKEQLKLDMEVNS